MIPVFYFLHLWPFWKFYGYLFLNHPMNVLIVWLIFFCPFWEFEAANHGVFCYERTPFWANGAFLQCTMIITGHRHLVHVDHGHSPPPPPPSSSYWFVPFPLFPTNPNLYQCPSDKNLRCYAHHKTVGLGRISIHHSSVSNVAEHQN